MIGKIKGILTEINGNVGLIETAGGLSYNVFLTPSLLTHILHQPLELYTHMQVRDDAHVLFGFRSKTEQKLFKLLISVSGVGPKTAFQIISFANGNELVQAVKDNDVAYFSRVPGLGKKTAMKIILELSEKLDSEFEMKQMVLSEDDKTVIDALVSLGFKSHDAKQLLSKLPKELSLEEKIRQGIQMGSPKK